MGRSSSRFVQIEQVNWVKSHSLDIDPNLRIQQLPLLANFKDTLVVAMSPRTAVVAYWHYFVTDGTWTLEFGGGEIENCTVKVHNNPIGSYREKKRFHKTPDVARRMQQVCGARGYSLCLRNCEHLATYIASGTWASSQMLPKGELGKLFISVMMQQFQRLVNTPPIELVSMDDVVEIYPPPARGFVQYAGRRDTLSHMGRDSFNVVILGPTGCGKSRIINLFYNQTICKSAADACSVTKHLDITTGHATISGERTPVTILDTIGLCDSSLSAGEVYNLLKRQVELNLAYIDRVIIVCSGRVEGVHIEQIKKYMEWLQYDTFPYRFTFVYNKADGQTEETRARNLSYMRTVLGAGAEMIEYKLATDQPSLLLGGERHPEGTSLDLAVTTGFPDGAPYHDIQQDLFALVDVTFMHMRNQGKIPVNKTACVIL